MKVALFILFYAVFYVSSAFSSSLLQSHFKGKLSQTATKEIVPYAWDGFYTGLILGGQFGRSSDKTQIMISGIIMKRGLMQEQNLVTVILGIGLLSDRK